MAITVKHNKVSTIPDDADTSLVRPSDWNDDHVLTGTVPVANGGTGAATLTGYVVGNGTAAMTASATIPSTAVTGLGTISTQNANNVSITGGSISGTTVSGYIPTTEKAAALGVATLDSSTKVPISQIPDSVIGALSYQGTWNASTNTPTLTTSVGTKGYYYVVSVAGSTNLNGITDWQVGDWAVYSGTAWQKIDNTDGVTSVNTYTGAVVLTAADVGAVPYTGATGAVDLNAKSLVNVSNLGINTTTVPTIKIRAVGDNNSSSRIAMRGYSSDANSSAIRVTKFRGTFAAPQAPQSGDSLGKFELAGYGTTSSEGYPQASLEGVATEAWGATARGTKALIKVTPNTTTTQVTALTIDQNSAATFASSVTATSFSGSGSSLTGVVTSVTGTSPVVSSGGQTPAISMPAATTSVSGYLTSTDWTTFNNKSNTSGTVTSVAATVPSFLSVSGSPITSSGTLALTYSGTALPILNGGTGQTTASAAFNALSPLTTAGDTLYGGTSGAGTRLAIGTAGQVLTVNSGATAPQWSTPTIGTVTAVSVTSANGFAGTSSGGATPALTLSTSITGVLKGNGTAISAATAGTDYSAGTSALGTGILKSTTTTGALTIAVAADFPTLNQNTTGSAATLTTPRAIYGNNFDGSVALTQIIASTYGGTGNGFTKFTGATTAEKTYTLPDSSVTLLYAGGPLGTPSSGTLTNATGLPVGGISATGTPSASTYLRGDGAWSAVTASSATNLAGGALGSVPYQLLSGTTVFLAGNTTTTPQFLTSTGVLGVATAPAYTSSTGSGNVVLATSPTLVTPVLGTPTSATLTNATGLPLSTGVTGTLPAANGGTAQSTYATGDILYASAANTLSKLTVGSTGQVLTVASGAPSWAAAASSNITSLGLYENSATIGANYTIGTGNNAMSAGPITISTGFTVTVPTGSTWTVV